MCGRFTLTARPEEVARQFELDETPELAARYNVAPGQDVATIDAAGGRRALSLRRWGLVPRWAEDPAVGQRMINARAETVSEKPAYRDAFRRRRCLVPADGFYEWAAGPAPRQPHHIHLPDRGLFAMAGLWERWRGPEGSALESCSVITTGANEVVGALHDRMPVILHPRDWARWLAGGEDPGALRALLVPWPAERTRAEPVSQRVNDVAFDDAACLEPAAPLPVQGRLW